MKYRVGLKIKKRRNWFSIVFWTTVWGFDLIILGWLTACVFYPSVMNATINAIYSVW